MVSTIFSISTLDSHYTIYEGIFLTFLKYKKKNKSKIKFHNNILIFVRQFKIVKKNKGQLSPYGLKLYSLKFYEIKGKLVTMSKT